MTDTALTTTTWPLAPGEHPTLPRLRCELHEARPAVTTGRTTTLAQSAYARVLFSPLPVLMTASPDRLRSIAIEIMDLADALEQAHALGVPGQQALDTKAG